MFHIWGDEDCGDDQVADTPTQKEENTGCPTFPQASCNNTSDMFMNYMDYTHDACMNLFTQGQKTVMQSSLSRYRAGLLTSPGCQPVQIPALDAAVQGIISPAYVVCENQVAPVVVLKNLGSQPLTWVQIAYRIDNGPSQTVDWSGALATFGTATVALPSLPVTAGAHTLTVSIVSRNGVATDASSANDQYVTAFQVQGLGLPLTQGFESPVFPPEGWRVQNPDYGVTWSRTTRAAKAGAASAYLQNYDYDAAGQVDELVLPPLNLTSRTAPVLTFQLAYSLYSSSDYSDTLEVWVSTDCGVNYQRVYQKFGRSLTTTTPHYTDKEFVPTANQWRLETVDLSAFANTATALVKFRHVTEYENNLYLDDVKVDGVPLGTAEEQALQALQVAPNPTTGLVQITSPVANVERVQVLDAVGKVVQEASYSQGKLAQLSLANQPNGIYLLRLVTPKGVVVRRVLLMR
ncbi:T9SS-dependent choice-of-anchor J family protein [Rufibacter ruber]|uniref:T9SS-dependent choice-of-anchor J family protein n=1 Tax=Rufibacter ruber TaxID=1783499 RepID=UPI0030C68222